MTARDDLLQRGRAAYPGGRWADAYGLLLEADAGAPLDGEDLERLGVAAHLLGRQGDCIALLERAHQAALASGDTRRALRAAFWLTSDLMELGEPARAGGWAARAHRLLEDCPDDCAEQGYVAVLDALQAVGTGDLAAAREHFRTAVAAASRHGDADLEVLARHGVGRSLLQSDDPEGGLALLDDVMVDLTGRGLSPIVVGIVYCSALEACLDSFEVRRAREWTAALMRWCEAQPDMVPHRGRCLAYRSEVMRMGGAWPDALEEGRRACQVLSQPSPHPALGPAVYQLAEAHRLRGEFAEAEEHYREAMRWGRPPEPGMALLWLAQGRVQAAEAAIRRALDEAQDRVTRSRLLPPFVEVVLAAGDVGAARRAANELGAIARALGAPMLEAYAGHAEGEVLLAEGRAGEALAPLRRALGTWQDLEVPYEAARSRALIGRACLALGDAGTAEMELDAARWAFEQLGAAPDIAAMDALLARSSPGPVAGLTAREVEVLCLVAAGKTNRAIASDLVISEKTVARHMSNILGKLDLPSRSAATAYAYEQGLIPGR